MWHANANTTCEKARENTRKKYDLFIYSQNWLFITTKSSIDDDCLRLKICSLNRKVLRSIPDGFTYVDPMSGLIKMIKKWISNIHPLSASLGLKNLAKNSNIRIFRIAYYIGNSILDVLGPSENLL